ncbi:hypothetical protein ACWGK7_19280 (plasmid) [Sphingomonas aurantiaca]
MTGSDMGGATGRRRTRLPRGWMIACFVLVVGIAVAFGLYHMPSRAVAPTPPPVGSATLARRLAADADFFPVAVWYQSPASVARWAALGVNVFLSPNGEASAADLERFRAAGVYMIPRRSIGFPVSSSDATVLAWAGNDEPDNAQPLPGGGWGTCVPPVVLRREYTAHRVVDRRPLFRNFGRGVALPGWNGRGACAGNEEGYYPAAIRASDIVSFDIYPVEGLQGRLELVAQGTRNLARWIGMAGGDKWQWAVIEAGSVHGAPAPTAHQLRSMVWLSVINGGRGLVLFPWQVKRNGERLDPMNLFAHPELLSGLTRTLDEIRTFAPVIKGGTVLPVPTYASTATLSLMARRHGALRVFAASESAMPATAAIDVAALDGTVFAVHGEGRSVMVRDRRIIDTFAGYGVHLYTERRSTAPSGGA